MVIPPGFALVPIAEAPSGQAPPTIAFNQQIFEQRQSQASQQRAASVSPSTRSIPGPAIAQPHRPSRVQSMAPTTGKPGRAPTVVTYQQPHEPTVQPHYAHSMRAPSILAYHGGPAHIHAAASHPASAPVVTTQYVAVPPQPRTQSMANFQHYGQAAPTQEQYIHPPEVRTHTPTVPPYTRVPGIPPYSLYEPDGRPTIQPIRSLMKMGTSRVVPIFRGKNAREWIEAYEARGRAEKASAAQLVEHLQFNVSTMEPNIWARVKKHPAYLSKDWEWIKSFLLTGFEGPESQKYTVYDLDSWVETPRRIETVEEFNDYTNNFQDIADPLHTYGSLTTDNYIEKFHRGLPDNIRQELRVRFALNTKPSFEEVTRMVLDIVNPDTFFGKLDQTIRRQESKKANKALLTKPTFSIEKTASRISAESLAKHVEQLTVAMEKFATTSTTKRAPYAQKTAGATDAKPAMTGTGDAARSNTTTSPATGANTTPLGGGDYTPPSGCYYCGNEEHNKYQCATFKEHRNKGWVTIDKGKIAYMDTNPVRGPRGTLHLVIQKQAQEGSLPGVPQAQTGASLQSNVYELASEDGSTWDEEEAALAMLMGQIDNEDFDWEAYPARTADEALGPSPVATKRRTTTNSRNAGESGGLPAQVRFKEPPAQPVSAPTTQGAPTPPPSVPNPTSSGQPPTSTNQQPVANPAPAATIQQAAPTTVPPQAPPAPPTTAGVAPAAPAALAAPAAPAVPVTPAAPEQTQATASPATEITPADAAMRDLEEEDELAEGPDLVDLDGTGRNFLSTKIPPTHKRLRTSRLRRESEPDKVAKTLLDQVVSLRFRDIIGVSPAVQKVVLDHLRNELVPIPSTGRPMPWLVTEGEHLVPNQAAVSTFASSESELGKLVVNQVLTQLSKEHEEEKPLYTAALPVTTVTIGGHSLKALLDTGSQLNTISDEVRQALGLGLRVDYRHRIKGAGGHLTKLLGISENVEICFSGIP
ncbi:hypothetical protein OC846_006802, partial [Tilletia horrida]